MVLFGFVELFECGISEDCFYFNVWIVVDGFDEKCLVIFWIYGGGNCVGVVFNLCSSGYNLLWCGVVVVLVNYCLGVVGFFVYFELICEQGILGNYVGLDLIVVL